MEGRGGGEEGVQWEEMSAPTSFNSSLLSKGRGKLSLL